MSEVTFAKQFLATIDKKPIKLPADHVSDPRKYPNQSPYILPRQTHPFPRRSGPTSTQQAASSTLTATLKPMRAGETITLPSITLDTTIHDLKTQYASQTGLAQDKIKLLYNKKPAQDLKTLKDLGVSGDVELSVMIMGGSGGTPRAQSPAVTPKSEAPEKEAVPQAGGDAMDVDEKSPAPESEKATAEAGKTAESGAGELLKGEEFWDDLKGFLSQRLRDEKEGEKLVGVFRQAWKGSL
ncbi:hypothetical protein M409DRAFT_68448 [Zasmidium cellare ATCC 36951]|uniref:Ubiquitin-like domain-containing protein n=1 Tax=Zasmidium cellare ATCC 36951 TaxID=1080233 RepID=A0A6A6C8M0_ZASCE|nr:uncharacterized protein M409DRAFT_68448 [Zasmidium cellare ATCC 36951]KAF2163527.1 hypothetical protein M409DRAFT_68448 [Zasmidium cellare ATCC 36951]